MYAGHTQHRSRMIPVDGKNLLETTFLPVVILNRHEIPHCLDSPRVATINSHIDRQTSL